MRKVGKEWREEAVCMILLKAVGGCWTKVQFGVGVKVSITLLGLGNHCENLILSRIRKAVAKWLQVNSNLAGVNWSWRKMECCPVFSDVQELVQKRVNSSSRDLVTRLEVLQNRQRSRSRTLPD